MLFSTEDFLPSESKTQNIIYVLEKAKRRTIFAMSQRHLCPMSWVSNLGKVFNLSFE